MELNRTIVSPAGPPGPRDLSTCDFFFSGSSTTCPTPVLSPYATMPPGYTHAHSNILPHGHKSSPLPVRRLQVDYR